MQTSSQAFAANPFAMLLDPARVAHEVACSERLQRIQGRIYRPLDKPLIAKRGTDQDQYDRMVDDSEIADADPPSELDSDA